MIKKIITLFYHIFYLVHTLLYDKKYIISSKNPLNLSLIIVLFYLLSTLKIKLYKVIIINPPKFDNKTTVWPPSCWTPPDMWDIFTLPSHTPSVSTYSPARRVIHFLSYHTRFDIPVSRGLQRPTITSL